MKLYHTTHPDRVNKILQEGLKINSAYNKTVGAADYIKKAYRGIVPIFLSTKPGKYKNGVILEIDATGLPLVADIPSLLDHDGYMMDNYSGIYWEEMVDDPKADLIYKLGDSNGEIKFSSLNKPNSKKVILAIQITETCAVKQDIPPDRIKVVGNIKEAISKNKSKAEAARKFLRQIKAKNPELFQTLVQKAEWFLNKDRHDYSAKDLKTAFRSELNREPEMNPIQSPDTYGIKMAIDAVANEKEEATSAKRLFGNTLDQVFKEEIELDIDVGDTVLGGRFKNKQITVKKIGKDELNQPTINDKPLLKYRIKKDMPEKKNLKETYEEELLSEEEWKSGGVRFFQMGDSLPKKLKNRKTKSKKPLNY